MQLYQLVNSKVTFQFQAEPPCSCWHHEAAATEFRFGSLKDMYMTNGSTASQLLLVTLAIAFEED